MIIVFPGPGCTDLAHARALDGPGKVSMDLFVYTACMLLMSSGL